MALKAGAAFRNEHEWRALPSEKEEEKEKEKEKEQEKEKEKEKCMYCGTDCTESHGRPM